MWNYGNVEGMKNKGMDKYNFDSVTILLPLEQMLSHSHYIYIFVKLQLFLNALTRAYVSGQRTNPKSKERQEPPKRCKTLELAYLRQTLDPTQAIINNSAKTFNKPLKTKYELA